MSLVLDYLIRKASLYQAFALVSLAGIDPETKLDTYFMSVLGKVVFQSPSPEEWKRWAELNQSALGRVGQEPWWNFAGESMSISMETLPDGRTPFFTIKNTSDPPEEHPTSPQVIKINQTSLLKGYGSIPNTWLFKGYEMYEAAEQPLPPDLMHDAFLASFILDVDDHANADNFQAIRQFIKDNKVKIDKLRSSFRKSPVYLGGGEDGSAFDIGGGAVLKVFKGEAGFRAALQAMERLHKTPQLAKTEAMIYDAGELGTLNTPRFSGSIYYYIQEKMTPIRALGSEELLEALRKIIGVFASMFVREKYRWEQLKTRMDEPGSAADIQTDVKKGAQRMATYVKDRYAEDAGWVSSKIKDLNPNWLPLLAEEIIMKYLTGRTDLHLGNLGLTGYGELRYFDPAHSSWKSELNINLVDSGMDVKTVR